MEERIYKPRNGMTVAVLTALGYLAAIGLIIFAETKLTGPLYVISLVVSLAWILLGWILILGLRILKPQEAMVLTLFGKYVGTLKETGFFFVNPFSSSVNPAAFTSLRQSGDVNSTAGDFLPLAGKNSIVHRKVSLKYMTLNNNKQKINDCLGNPVEIGIAVI